MEIPYRMRDALALLHSSPARGALFGGRPQASGTGRPGVRARIVASLREAGLLAKGNPTDAEILAAVDAAKAARSAAHRPLSRSEILAGAAARVAARQEAEYRRYYPNPEQTQATTATTEDEAGYRRIYPGQGQAQPADADEAGYRRYYPKGT